MGIFGSKANLPLENFNTTKRYDLYLVVGDDLACLRDVSLQRLRTFERIDPDDPSPVGTYLEVTDASGSTIIVDTANIALLADSGTSFQLMRMHI